MIAEILPEEPPVVAPEVNLTAVVGEPFSYQVSATSPEGYSLTYTLTAAQYIGVAVDPETGIVTWLPKVPTNNDIRIEVGDGHGGYAGEDLLVTVNQNPSPPVITSVPPAPAVAGSPYQYQVEAQDANTGVTLTYGFLDAPDGMVIDPDTGLISWTPPAGETTYADVAVVVFDSLGLATGQQFVLTSVEPVPEVPPTITSSPETNGLVNVPYVYQVQATSANGTALSYSLTTAPAGMSISPTGMVTWITTTPQTVPVTVQVTDAEGGTATQTYNLQVNSSTIAVNPTITSHPPGPAQLDFAYQYQVTVTDTSGTADAYSLENAPAGMSIDPSTGLVTWLPQGGVIAAPQPVTISVQNGTGGSATQSFNLVVDVPVPNSPITITSMPTGPAVVGLPYEYQVVAQDPNGSPLSYWLDAAPAGMALSSTGLLTCTPTSDQIGFSQVTIAVTDGLGGQASQTYSLAVVASAADRPPVITSTPATNPIPVFDNYQYQVVATDPDGDALTYSLDNSPAGMSLDPSAGLFTWTPNQSQTGSFPITLNVSDGRGGVVQQTFTLTVVAAGSATDHAPTISSEPTQPAVVGQTWQYQVVASDPDDDALSYSLTTAPTGMAISATGLVTWTAASSGSNPVAISVSDGRGQSATQSFMLVADPNPSLSAPVFTSTPSAHGPVGADVAVPGGGRRSAGRYGDVPSRRARRRQPARRHDHRLANRHRRLDPHVLSGRAARRLDRGDRFPGSVGHANVHRQRDDPRHQRESGHQLGPPAQCPVGNELPLPGRRCRSERIGPLRTR